MRRQTKGGRGGKDEREGQVEGVRERERKGRKGKVGGKEERRREGGKKEGRKMSN